MSSQKMIGTSPKLSGIYTPCPLGKQEEGTRRSLVIPLTAWLDTFP
jgi:hypothetical protein